MRDAIAAVSEAYRVFSAGQSLTPLRTSIYNAKQDGVTLFMPAFIPSCESLGAKILSIYPHNVVLGKKSLTATMVLLNSETGEVSALIDGTYLTQLRTGAASGCAIDYLARRDARIGALIGTGAQALCQLEAMLTMRKLEKVFLYGLDRAEVVAFVNKAHQELKCIGKTKLVPALSSTEAIQDADIIITVTNAHKPVFDGKRVKAGALISAIGAFTPEMQELDDEVIARAGKIFVDSREATQLESGELLRAVEHGVIDKSVFEKEIGQLINKKLIGRSDDHEIIIFKSVGIATQDAVTATHIYQKALEKNVGLTVSF